MIEDQGEVALILSDQGSQGIHLVETYVPGDSRSTFTTEAVTNLYLRKSTEGIHNAVKPLRNEYQYEEPPVAYDSTGREFPVNQRKIPRKKIAGFHKHGNLSNTIETWSQPLTDDQKYPPSFEQDLASHQLDTANIFYDVPAELSKVLSNLTVTLPPEAWGSEQVKFLEQVKQKAAPVQVLASKKYKPVALKVKPHLGTLPDEFRIVRNIVGDPLEGMPVLNPNPPKFQPTGRYTEERREQVQKDHTGNFLWPQERDLIDDLMCKQNEGFAWEESEKGRFREDFFPPVDMPVIPHVPWVLRPIKIPPGIFNEVCAIIKNKLDSGVYEPSNSSYRSRWFCVVKKDGKKLRLVHSLEPLNAVTIAHSGLPPATEELAEAFAGRACGGTLDLYVGYDERHLAEKSRDMTTFSTPYGALRLKTLPMGWTNSVPIFHEDVTHILKDEIPAFTRPYIDDVPVRGPATRYQDKDGNYETIRENNGIRRFVWEHMINMNRIIQRMKYSGGTFSGHKAIICANETVVVGHTCCYEGRKPAEERVKVISDWVPCECLRDVRSFLGTAGVFRTFVKDYSKKALAMTRLTRDGVLFHWGEEEQASMDSLKRALETSPMLKPLNYDWDTPIILSVDTSYMAVGFYLSQEDPEDPKKRYYAKFLSITLDEREARYSQSKRELFGLHRALMACKYYLLGCRKLKVEVDAKYIKGMLSNIDSLTNGNLQRWAEEILMFHFTLVHVPGKVHGPDGLSRRVPAPEDIIIPRPPGDEEEDELPSFEYEEPDDLADEDKPLPFEDFKDAIDTKTGYLQEVREIPVSLPENSVNDFEQPSEEYRASQLAAMAVEDLEKWVAIDEFPDLERSSREALWETLLPHVEACLRNSEYETEELSTRQLSTLKDWASKDFFIAGGKLYKKHKENKHRRVLLVGKRLPVVTIVHDKHGHKGQYSVRQLVGKRFWWPGMEDDMNWFVKTCILCQKRQKIIIHKEPTITPTPGIFETAFVDTFRMPKSGGKNPKIKKYDGYNAVTVARCGLSGWPEARALINENADTLGDWLFEDILCRWGCIKQIITDNGPAIKKAMVHIEAKYGVKGILITPYNKQANGKVERGHWDIRQSLFKVCRGNPEEWPAYLHEVLWAERITVKRTLGQSPFYAVTGCEPILPLDINEVTWLVDIPDSLVSHSDLIAFRAQQLVKHKEDVKRMKQRVTDAKIRAAAKFMEDHKNRMPSHKFKTGELVLVRNTRIEEELNHKFKERFMGPYAVVSRTTGGNYVLCELDGSLLKDKIAQFRVIPFYSRKDPSFLGDLFFKRLHMIRGSVGKVMDELNKKA